ncbi:MAG: FHA domain-containing protein [Anaerolineae bacterium]
MSFSMGDVYSNEIKTLILETIPALNELGEEIARLYFEYDEITEQGTQHQILELPIIVNITADNGANPPNPEVRRTVYCYKPARARRDAIKAVHGDYEQASHILRQAANNIEDSQIKNRDLVDEQSALLKQADEMQLGVEYYDSRSRKMMATQAIYTMTDHHERTQSLRSREIERSVKEPEVEKKPGISPTVITWREQTIPINGDLMRVGRAPQNEVALDAKNVSRFHCQIKQENGRLVLEDLGSTNGTFVNEVRITEPHFLSVGDVVRVGRRAINFSRSRITFLVHQRG